MRQAFTLRVGFCARNTALAGVCHLLAGNPIFLLISVATSRRPDVGLAQGSRTLEHGCFLDERRADLQKAQSYIMRRLQILAALATGSAVLAAAPCAWASGPPLTADFNQDGYVDNGDLIRWSEEFDVGSPPMSGHNFMAWQLELGAAPHADASISHQPEPATIVVWGLIAAGSGAVFAVRRRRETRAVQAA